MELALVYQWVNFVIFVGGLYYLLKNPMRNFLGDRRESIRRELNEVARARLDIETQYKDYRKRMAEAGEEIKQLKSELRHEGEIEKEAIIKRSQQFAHKIREDANRAGDQELARVKHQLRQQTLFLALEKAKESVESVIQNDDQVRLFDWGLNNLKEERDERESFS